MFYPAPMLCYREIFLAATVISQIFTESCTTYNRKYGSPKIINNRMQKQQTSRYFCF